MRSPAPKPWSWVVVRVAFYGWVVEDRERWPPIHVTTTRQRVKSSAAVLVHVTRHLDHRDVMRYGLHIPHPAARNVRVHGIPVDCWYPGVQLVVELDSRAHHSRRAEMAADRRRDRALKRQGVDTLRLVWEDLDADDPQAARDLQQHLDLGS